MFRRFRTVSCLCCALLLNVALADDTGPVDSTSNSQRVIVLLTGRVIIGGVKDVPGGYLVDNNVGSVVIPFTQVRLTAKDLPDAYHKLKEGITEPTASQHVSLGQWCYDNRLYHSAREQVKAALLLEPERKEARTLLRQIERITTGDGFEATIPAAPRKSRDGFEASPTQALGELSPAVTQEYVRKIQPLLMNKCGNARCHGAAATSDFRLTPVRLGISGYRTLTDQNLSAVLRVIDFKQPHTSPLLMIPQGDHGGRGLIWNGPRADEQLADLRAWVIQAAQEQPLIESENGQKVVAAAGSAGSDSGNHGSNKRDSFLDDILAEQRPDKFDPAIFNRLVHGRD